MQNFVRTAIVTFLGLAVHASAEPRVCIGGDLDHLTPTQKNVCWTSANKVRKDAVKFHAPEDWHFFVICTESDWTAYAAMSNRGVTLNSLNADTDIEKRTTYLRGEAITIGDPSRFHQLIAHEAARGLLQSLDEIAIQRQVAVWIPENKQAVLTLAASR